MKDILKKIIGKYSDTTLELSKTGYITGRINNIYIHSKYDPLKEAEKFIMANYEAIKDNKIVVYGIGFGYHILEIIKHIDSKKIIVIFEYNKELIKIARDINPELFNNENIKIFDKNKEFYSKFAEEISKSNDIIIHKPSLETIKEMNYDLYSSIKWYSIKKKALLKNRYVLVENEKRNFLIKHKSIEEFIEEFKQIGKKCIVISAGPSLDKEIARIRKIQSEFYIISVGTVTKTLVDNGVKSNAIIIIDSSELVYEQIKYCHDDTIPLCFLSTASNKAVELYKGNKYIFFNNEINTNGTVAVSAIDIACKLGTSEIILVGQDLAAIEGNSHISAFKDIYSVNCDEGPAKTNAVKVKSVYGNDIETKETYVYFKRGIECLIRNNKEIKFFNCSRGAYIEGAINISLEKYLEGEKCEWGMK